MRIELPLFVRGPLSLAPDYMEYRLIGSQVTVDDAKTGESISSPPLPSDQGNRLEHHSERDRDVLERGRSITLLDLIVPRLQEGIEPAERQLDAGNKVPA